MFFFVDYGHHRDLHSFPTRRSSDLLRNGDDSRLDPLPCLGTIEEAERVVREHQIDHVFVALQGRDRKSTRLNSSHGSISYAVFCLKKKKSSFSRVASTGTSDSDAQS